MRTIKILYLIDRIYSASGGTEKQLLEIIRRIDRTAFDPFLVCLQETAWSRNNVMPCPSETLGFDGFVKKNVFSSMRKFQQILKREQFDVAQTFFEDSMFFCFLATLTGTRPKVLLSSRRDIGMLNQPWYHKIYRLAVPCVNLCFDGIVANGENIKKYVMKKEFLHSAKIKVIYNGFDVSSENYAAPDIFIKENAACWIGVVANLSPVKRLDVFVRALAILVHEYNLRGVKAVHLGEGGELASIQELARSLGVDKHIFFMGSVNNVGAYLDCLDIGVLCSDREGFSNAIMEYMGHSLPVVATAVGGNTELVDAGNGICVPPGNPAAMAEALLQLASDPEKRKAMGRVSRRKVEGVYSWSRTMREWETYYRELVRQ